MIVCSCNVFSDHQVRSAVAKAVRPPRMSQVYACLGCSAQCGRCAHAVKRIMDETLNCAIGAIHTTASLHN
jgi:bacterioferritin-associated ferredoxin